MININALASSGEGFFCNFLSNHSYGFMKFLYAIILACTVSCVEPTEDHVIEEQVRGVKSEVISLYSYQFGIRLYNDVCLFNAEAFCHEKQVRYELTLIKRREMDTLSFIEVNIQVLIDLMSEDFLETYGFLRDDLLKNCFLADVHAAFVRGDQLYMRAKLYHEIHKEPLYIMFSMNYSDYPGTLFVNKIDKVSFPVRVKPLNKKVVCNFNTF